MRRDRTSHAAKTKAERKAYSESVLGSTVENVDTTGSATSTVDQEAPPPGDRKRPTDWKYEVGRWFSEKKWELSAGIIITLIGWLCLQQAALNREVGIASARVVELGPKVEKIGDKLAVIDTDNGRMQFQIGELWDMVFKGRKRSSGKTAGP